MTVQSNSESVCATHRVLPFSREAVFAAFTDGGRLASWWGPAGFTNSFEVFEFRTGGHWKFIMHGPDGSQYPNESVFLEAAPERVVIRHGSQPHFTLSITLSEEHGQTRVNWHQAFDDAEVAARMRPICEPANEQNLDRLHAVLAAAA